MNNPSPNGLNPHPGDYDLPHDQLAFEFQIIDEYNQAFPQQAFLLERALTALKRFTGFYLPQYRTSRDVVSEPDKSNDVEDSDMYFDSEGVEYKWATLIIRSPYFLAIDDPKLTLSKPENVREVEKDGLIVVGEIPDYTHRLMEDLFRLIGAKIVREDAEYQNYGGKIMRKGSYQGKDIYIEEIIGGLREDFGNQRWYAATVASKEVGERLLVEMGAEDFHDFLELSGLDRVQASLLLQNNPEINRTNYSEFAGSIRALSEPQPAKGRLLRAAQRLVKLIGFRSS